MRHVLLLPLLLAGCGTTPDQLVFGFGGLGIASLAILQRSPIDAWYSLFNNRDCSIVRLDRGQSYCRDPEPPPAPQPFCTRSLGVVDCWRDRSELPGQQAGVADGPAEFTPAQEAYRTRGWP